MSEDNRVNSNDVWIVGVGLTPVGEHWEKSLREIALEAIAAALAEAPGLSPQALYVANTLAPALSGQSQLGSLLADFAGLRGVEAMTIEAAGASGGAALRQAYLALKAGAIDVALVVGLEKVTDQAGPALQAALATATDAELALPTSAHRSTCSRLRTASRSRVWASNEKSVASRSEDPVPLAS